MDDFSIIALPGAASLPLKCAAAGSYGQHEKCTAPEDRRRRCQVCSHTVCDACEAPHCCSHDDRRRLRPDGFGFFGYCDHANACVECHGHGKHSAYCRFRRANVGNTKLEEKRQAKRAEAIAAVDEALVLLPRLRATLADTSVNEDVLTRVVSALELRILRNSLESIAKVKAEEHVQ